MKLIADLHLHSCYARACSKDITLENLEKYARQKGLGMLGTGDFTHPLWLKVLKEKLHDNGDGVFLTKTGFPFILQVEVANFFQDDGRARKVHNVILAKSFDVVDQINQHLSKRGNLMADGRPMFAKYPCVDLVDDLMKIDKDIEIIPAHAWTPYFGVFGSMSGFDSVEECFKEKSNYIHAIETGMSSDPAMNWRLSKLDKYNLVSGSDSHSFWPWRIGREANVFDINLSYKELIQAIRTKKGFLSTIETEPAYGRYHYDGHSNCNICLSPEDAMKLKNICPVCKKPLTIGVAHRVETLSDRPVGFIPKGAVPFQSLIPLHEIIAAVHGSAITTKKTWEVYGKLIAEFKDEFSILLDADETALNKIVDPKITRAIISNRSGKIEIKPGYDGEYGMPIFDGVPRKITQAAKPKIKEIKPVKEKNKQTKEKPNQKGLEDFY